MVTVFSQQHLLSDVLRITWADFITLSFTHCSTFAYVLANASSSHHTMQAVAENNLALADFPSRLKRVLEERGMNANQLAQLMKSNRTVVYDILSGKRPNPTASTVEKILSAIANINANWLLTGKGEPFISDQPAATDLVASEPSISGFTKRERAQLALKASTSVPSARVYLLDEDVSAAAGLGAIATSNRAVESYPYIEMDGLSRGKSYSRIKVRGDSMSPTLRSGDYLIAAYCEEGVKAVVDDRVYVVVLTSGDIIVKRLLNRLPQRDLLYVKSDNPSYSGYDLHPSEIAHVHEAKMLITYNLANQQLELYQRLSAVEEKLERLTLR